MAKKKKAAMQDAISALPVIGWREWVSLPDLGVRQIKAKVDTGARSSSVHAFGVSGFQRHGKDYVRFGVHPDQRDTTKTVTAEAEVLGYRRIKSSAGHVSIRPVVATTIELDGRRWSVELTLANRDTMGFRMLLGRQAVRGRFTVDAGRSYIRGKRKRRRLRKRRQTETLRQQGPPER